MLTDRSLRLLPLKYKRENMYTLRDPLIPQNIDLYVNHKYKSVLQRKRASSKPFDLPQL